MHLGLIGYGNIATTLLGLLPIQTRQPLQRLTVLALPDMVDEIRHDLHGKHAGIARSLEVVTGFQHAAALPDLVVECAGHRAVCDHVPALLENGTDTVLVSIGAMADAALERTLRLAARKGGAKLILPAGAIGGIDLLSALSATEDVKVRYRGIKPPAAWAGTPAETAVNLAGLTQAHVFFSGTARDAASAYPKNANVAATLALAGPGFDKVTAELVADPSSPGNVHEYSVQSPIANYTMRVENRPSPGNAKTSVSTVYSVLREIRNHAGPVVV